MIDDAQTRMSQGAPMALASVSGINDNMSQSHYHDYFEMYFLDSGERYHIMDDKLFKIKAGDCIIFPPHTMHRSYSDEDCAFSRVVLYFKPEIIESDSLLQKLMHSGTIYRPETKNLHNLRRYIYSMLEEQDSPLEYHEEEMISLLHLTLISILRMQQVYTGVLRETRITQIIHYIHENYAQEISLKDIADQFYISEYYLCREFKKNTNRTVIEYIQRTRIMNAQRLFMETNKNVSEVAVECGFGNLTHFNRVFKEIEGSSPSQYRKKCRELHKAHKN